MTKPPATASGTNRRSGGLPHYRLVTTIGAIAAIVMIVGLILGVDLDNRPGKGEWLEALFSGRHVASEGWIWAARIGGIAGASTWTVYILWLQRRRSRKRAGGEDGH